MIKSKLKGFKLSHRKIFYGTLFNQSDKLPSTPPPPLPDTYLFQDEEQFLFQDGEQYEFN